MKHLRCHNHYANDLKKWLKEDFNKQYRSISKRSKRPKTISVNKNKHDDENEDENNNEVNIQQTTLTVNISEDELYKQMKEQHVTQHMDDVLNLLRSQSKQLFLIDYEQMKKRWCPRFKKYFETWHLPHIDELGEPVRTLPLQH
ncbi:unnamed protein product, partial [Didymodactylos carnosus]